MSSFVVHPTVINQIVTYIDSQAHKGNYIHLLSKYNIKLDEKDRPAFREGLASSLWSLNIEAVNQRYPDTVENLNGAPGSYQDGKLIHHVAFKLTSASKIQVYKSLQCLIYQCSEGNVPESLEYKFLMDLENAMAREIVSELPEYVKAEWDAD